MLLASLLLQTKHSVVLITSQNMDVARSLVGRGQDIIIVDAMSEDEAEQLLIKQARRMRRGMRRRWCEAACTGS